MTKNRLLLLAIGALAIITISTASYAFLEKNQRTPVEFFSGHTHHDEITVGAPQHSGGTDAYGCHNGSVPYHCH